MESYYLAIDIGASSGRHILGSLEKGKIVSEEVYRFDNKLYTKEGQVCWDYQALFHHILEGLRQCKTIGKIPQCVAIDTWAVDFVLLDADDKVIGNTVAYRDSRTEGMDEKVYERIDERQLYEKTGIQKQIFNSIYQLMAIKEQAPEDLNKAKDFLMVPDYFNFLLTGQKTNEYTNATTTGLICPETQDWDWDLIDHLGYPKGIFKKIVKPGHQLGKWTQAITDSVGYQANVIATTSHDTASAVVAIPTTEERPLYISSGTWSLMGTELLEPLKSYKSQKMNFTNEGGYEGRYRYLKNIMGLWMIQNVKAELAPDVSYESICQGASQAHFEGRVDCNDHRFLAPESMTQAIQDYLRQSGQAVAYTLEEISKVVYESLADCYDECLKEIEAITGQSFESIYVVGGGSKADYLNQLIYKQTQKRVLAGPSEATALGNIIVQMLADQQFDSLKEARQCLAISCDVTIYGKEK